MRLKITSRQVFSSGCRIQLPSSQAGSRQPLTCLQHRQQPWLPCSREGEQHPALPLGSEGGDASSSSPHMSPTALVSCRSAVEQPSPVVSERGTAGISHFTAIVPKDKGFTCPQLKSKEIPAYRERRRRPRIKATTPTESYAEHRSEAI